MTETYETLLLDVRDGVAHLTLNRPDNANGINLALARDLFHATLEIADDSPRRARCCSPDRVHGSAVAVT